MDEAWTGVGKTDVGRVRSANEDAYGVHPREGVFVVADGMGGHAAGEVASRLAVDAVEEALLDGSDDDAADMVAESLRRANDRIRRSAEENPAREGMGTTATILRVLPDDTGIVLGQVGDSRAYRLREGSLERLTRDQTWVQRQVDAGLLEAGEAEGHPYSNILVQALGLETEIEPEVVESEAEAGDLYLLCTDGLNAVLSDDDIRDALAGSGDDLEDAAALLVRRANEEGGPDNVTVVLARPAAP